MPRLALLAGGLATRLRPITEKIPKSLVSVAGEPFIAHQLRLLQRQGVTEIVLCLGYLGEMVQDYVKDGSAFGCSVAYSWDGPVLKGTGGAIQQALPMLGDPFFVMYGDSYLPINFESVLKAYQNSGLTGLMTVFRNYNQWDKSNVDFRGNRVLRYDKRQPPPSMEYIDYGLGILRPEAFASWQGHAAFDLAAVYEALVQRGELAGFESKERFFEVGSHSGLNEAATTFQSLLEPTTLESKGTYQ